MYRPKRRAIQWRTVERSLGHVIELCRTCGFDIPADADACPVCAPAAPPSLAARQAAGLALPTRSVHEVPGIAPRAEPDDQPPGPARAARSAFSYTTTLALVTLATAALTWLAHRPRFVLQVPDRAFDVLDDVTLIAASASIVMLVIGLIAMVVWCVRAMSWSLRHRMLRG